ncbi:MAG: carbohydrate ABC transporter permease [Acidimicrobiia bacterium]|nr:carbohydrate ABC transporter permease [Acidimicrobiia bacterium]
MTTVANAPSRRRSWVYIPLTMMALFYLVPLFVMLNTGFKSFDEVSLRTMWNLPAGLSFDNFRAAWEALRPNLWNSVKIVVPAATISSVLGSINGFVLAKWKFKWANIVFPVLLFGMFIPYQAVLIPLVTFMSKIGLAGGTWGLVLVHVVYGIPITTLIFRNYFATIPETLIEAAKIDGAGIFSTYTRIMLPLAIPSFVVVYIWQFTSAWNDFLFAVVLTNTENWPVTVALNNLAGSQIIAWNVQMAASFLAAVPTLLIYIFLGRYFLSGMMSGALKE